MAIRALRMTSRCMEEVLKTKDFYFDPHEAQSALRQRSMFNIIDMGNGCKVDFIFRKSGAFDDMAFERRRKAAVFGVEHGDFRGRGCCDREVELGEVRGIAATDQ